MRTEVTTPLFAATRSALAELQQTEASENAADEQVRAASWFGKRRARDEHENA